MPRPTSLPEKDTHLPLAVQPLPPRMISEHETHGCTANTSSSSSSYLPDTETATDESLAQLLEQRYGRERSSFDSQERCVVKIEAAPAHLQRYTARTCRHSAPPTGKALHILSMLHAATAISDAARHKNKTTDRGYADTLAMLQEHKDQWITEKTKVARGPAKQQRADTHSIAPSS